MNNLKANRLKPNYLFNFSKLREIHQFQFEEEKQTNKLLDFEHALGVDYWSCHLFYFIIDVMLFMGVWTTTPFPLSSETNLFNPPSCSLKSLMDSLLSPNIFCKILCRSLFAYIYFHYA